MRKGCTWGSNWKETGSGKARSRRKTWRPNGQCRSEPGFEKCFLYADSKTRLPKWFRQFNWGVDIHYKATNIFQSELVESFSNYTHKELTIKISAPERAAMEMLYYVPSDQGFDEAVRIMESLMSLRPKMVQTLLEHCRQIKVKRLFLYLADKLHLPWFEGLDLGRIDIGKGKRVIEANGILDKKYLIKRAWQSHLARYGAGRFIGTGFCRGILLSRFHR